MKRRFIAAVLASAISAHAEGGPLDVPIRQYGFVLAVAILGGVVSFYGKVVSGKLPPWSLLHLVGEMATSGFAGLLAFWLCSFANTPEMLTAAMSGIAGYMGTRAINAIEDWAQRRVGSR